MNNPHKETGETEVALKALETLDLLGEVIITVDLKDGNGEKEYDLGTVLVQRVAQALKDARVETNGEWFLAIAHLTQEQRIGVLATLKDIRQHLTVKSVSALDAELHGNK